MDPFTLFLMLAGAIGGNLASKVPSVVGAQVGKKISDEIALKAERTGAKDAFDVLALEEDDE